MYLVAPGGAAASHVPDDSHACGSRGNAHGERAGRGRRPQINRALGLVLDVTRAASCCESIRNDRGATAVECTVA